MRSAGVVFLFAALSVNALADDSIKIGWIGPLSGNSAVLGIDSAPAAQIAVDERNAAGGIRGRRIELVVEDDQHETPKAVTAYKKLINDGVVAVLMSTYGGYLAAVAGSRNSDVPIINPLDCNEEIAKLPHNAFCVATLTESISSAIADHIKSSSNLPTGIIFDDHHPFMAIVSRALQKLLPEEQLIIESIDQNTFTGYQTLLQKFKNRKAKSLVFLGHDPMGQAMREARGIGIKSVFYTVGTITSPGFQKLAGDAADGTFVAYWEAQKTPAFEAFLTKFKSKAGRGPILELASIPSYDATRILLDALDPSSPEEGIAAGEFLRKALLETKDHPGLSGTISIDPDKVVRSIKERIYVFNNGRLTPVD